MDALGGIYGGKDLWKRWVLGFWTEDLCAHGVSKNNFCYQQYIAMWEGAKNDQRNHKVDEGDTGLADSNRGDLNH